MKMPIFLQFIKENIIVGRLHLHFMFSLLHQKDIKENKKIGFCLFCFLRAMLYIQLSNVEFLKKSLMIYNKNQKHSLNHNNFCEPKLF